MDIFLLTLTDNRTENPSFHDKSAALLTREALCNASEKIYCMQYNYNLNNHSDI